IANVVRFTLLTILGSGKEQLDAELAFYIRRIDQLSQPERFFTLSSQDFRLLNPNTLTCPIFRTKADATLTKKIYHAVPVLIVEHDGHEVNPWDVLIRQNFFSHTTDSGKFHSGEEISGMGGVRDS